MAIINEINGDIDTAIQWAQKAYEDYRVKIALGYVNILRNRKAIMNCWRYRMVINAFNSYY
ncbi:MAG: hypothetical protein WDO19_02945 [Bacteroidota bacterium]